VKLNQPKYGEPVTHENPNARLLTIQLEKGKTWAVFYGDGRQDLIKGDHEPKFISLPAGFKATVREVIYQ
jgi:hypothetical protein